MVGFSPWLSCFKIHFRTAVPARGSADVDFLWRVVQVTEGMMRAITPLWRILADNTPVVPQTFSEADLDKEPDITVIFDASRFGFSAWVKMKGKTVRLKAGCPTLSS